jgi:hypothetical protein
MSIESCATNPEFRRSDTEMVALLRVAPPELGALDVGGHRCVAPMELALDELRQRRTPLATEGCRRLSL